MSDATPRTPRKKTNERFVPGQTAEVRYVEEEPISVAVAETVIGPLTPQLDVDLVPIEQDFSAEMFRSGWMAALAEVELQWSQGHDSLSRFLATQKRDL